MRLARAGVSPHVSDLGDEIANANPNLTTEQVAQSVEFTKKCLRPDPGERTLAIELWGEDWIQITMGAPPRAIAAKTMLKVIEDYRKKHPKPETDLDDEVDECVNSDEKS